MASKLSFYSILHSALPMLNGASNPASQSVAAATNGFEMMQKAKRSIEEVFYCFLKVIHQISRSRGTKNRQFCPPNWAFLDCNSSFNSPMALKWCTKLSVVLKRCPIVFHGHLSNFKVTVDKNLPIFTQIGRFWTVTTVWIQWWLWNNAQSSIEKVPYCFSRSSVKFQGHK